MPVRKSLESLEKIILLDPRKTGNEYELRFSEILELGKEFLKRQYPSFYRTMEVSTGG